MEIILMIMVVISIVFVAAYFSLRGTETGGSAVETVGSSASSKIVSVCSSVAGYWY